MKRLNIRDYYQSYYQFPRAFMQNSKYKDMSDSSKIIYMLLTNRLEEALGDNQIDEEGNIYLIFPDDDLSALTGYSIKQILRSKRELILKKLLRQVFDTSTNETRLYLGDFEIPELSKGDENLMLEELIL